MRAYLITTGTVFVLLALAHVWRMVVEPSLLSRPEFHLTTIVSAALAAWAWRLSRGSAASS
jgi:hypothetical protein